ncbi:MAG: DUF2637 domain-containing protein [Micromonosporaceae bacterium]
MAQPGRVPRPDALIRLTACATVIALAAIAGAISYSHMQLLAAQHGETGWRAHAFPLSVDGIEIVASLVLLADRRAGRRSGWLPWTALAAGTAASVAANVAVGGSDLLGRVVAGWPAFALLVAIKLLSGLLEARESSPSAAVPDMEASGTVARGTVPRSRQMGSQPRPRRTDARDGDDPAALLPAARHARDAILSAGERVTRDRLAAQLRNDGHEIRNARVSILHRILRQEAAGQTAAISRG